MVAIYTLLDLCVPVCRTFFNPELFNIVLLDQRGCGSSTPAACLVDNNTDELVQDMEKLRKHLEIHNWVLLGGSWGVALSLAYAIKHPNRCVPCACCMRLQKRLHLHRGCSSVVTCCIRAASLAQRPAVACAFGFASLSRASSHVVVSVSEVSRSAMPAQLHSLESRTYNASLYR